MKQFFSFVLKEFKHIFRDRWTMLILLGMPIVQILLFGFAITTEVRNSPIAVYAPVQDELTHRITDELEARQYFSVYRVVGSLEEGEALFRQGKVQQIVSFTPDFSSKLYQTGQAQIQLIADGSDPSQAATVTGYLSGILASVQQDLLEEHQMQALIRPNVRMLYNPQAKSAYNFVPGVMGMILMLICAMMTSIAIVREKETGTMEILLTSPLKPICIVLAKAIPYLTLSLANLTAILLLSVFVLDVPIAGSLPLLLGLSMLYILLALSLGLLISTLVENQVAAMLTSGMSLMSPTMIFSGMMFPIESMPLILQGVSTLMPARWYIAAVKKVMIQGSGIGDITLELSILAAMTLFFLFVSIKNFKTRLA